MKKLTLALTFALAAAPLSLGAALVLGPSSPLTQDSRPVAPKPQERIVFEHRAFSSLLERHVQGEFVDYAALNRDRAMLDMYAAKTAKVTPAEMKTWDRAERMAFWINVYNAYTLQLILDNYDQGSGKRLDTINAIKKGDVSPWDQAIIPMPAFHPDGERKSLTLNQVENSIIRPEFNEPRIHAAVNCAAIGCPPLLGEAFTGAKLEAQLASQMKAFMAGTSRNQFHKADKKAILSSIFDWYGDDFKTEATAAKRATDLRDYLIANGPESAGKTAADRAWIRDATIEFGEYDWKLNDYGGK
jgi:hypothetical protein